MVPWQCHVLGRVLPEHPVLGERIKPFLLNLGWLSTAPLPLEEGGSQCRAGKSHARWLQHEVIVFGRHRLGLLVCQAHTDVGQGNG